MPIQERGLKLLTPKKINEVLIAIPKKLYDRVVADLSISGIFHVEQPVSELKGFSEKAYKPAAVLSSEKRAKIEGYFKALELTPELLDGVSIFVSDWIGTLNKTIEDNESLEREFEEKIEELNEIKNRIADLSEIKSVIATISYINANVKKASSTKNFFFTIGVIPKENVELVKSICAKNDVLVSIDEVEEDLVPIAFIASKEVFPKAFGEIEKLGYAPTLVPPEFSGIPKEAVREIDEEISSLNEKLRRVKKELIDSIDQLKRYYTTIYTLSEIFKILNYIASTKTMTFIHGYIDVSDSRRLKDLLNKSTGGAYMLYTLGTKRAEDKMPTKMEVPRFLKPFESILKMYGTPNYNEVIPTAFMAISMPIIFGLMFPDIGHGLLVVLFSLLYLIPRNKDMGKVGVVLGIAGMIAGFFSDEFFGPLPAKLIHMEDMWRYLGLKTAPLESPVDIAIVGGSSSLMQELFIEAMNISFWIGAFMLISGTLIGIINSYIKRDYEDMIGSKLPMFLLFLSAGAPFLIYFNVYQAGHIIGTAIFHAGGGGPFEAFVFYGAIVSIIWILIGRASVKALMGEGFKISPIESFIGMFEAMLLVLGNTISFLRILGLSLAHSGLMVGFTILAIVIDPVGLRNPLMFVGGLIIFIIGNLLTAGLEGIVAFAHDLRLHFYEWFNKFYSGNGIPFSPIKLPNVTIIFQ